MKETSLFCNLFSAYPFFKKMSHSRTIFLYFRLFNVHFEISQLTGFEQQTSGIGCDRSANWVTITALFSTELFHGMHHGGLKLDWPKQKAVVFMLNPKMYAKHAWNNFIVVWLLGRSCCSSPSSKELHGYTNWLKIFMLLAELSLMVVLVWPWTATLVLGIADAS